jgi:hypothetical protein
MDKVPLQSGGRRKPSVRTNVSMDRFGGKSGGRSDEAEVVGESFKAMGYIVLLIAFGFLIYYLAKTLPQLFTTLNKNIESKWVLGLIGASGASVVGLSLFYLRENKRLIYALLELGFAFATGWIAVGRVNTQDDLSVWTALGAAAYLVVRGMDNLTKAREEMRKSPSPEA